ncbi:MAG: sigma-70 family RNA polymerase sigma factor [Acholeplasmatales bacterium]|nr:sigma-70 family RNA polymerase sigma factor [Acholeplasmatales bacterium]
MTEKEFEIKYKLYNKILYSIIYGYTLNKEDSDDLLQDVFIKYLKSNKIFNNQDEEKYYLIRITINTCNDYYKHNKNKSYLEYDPVDEKNDNMILKHIIKNLPKKYKEVIIMYYYESLDINSISNILKISVSSTKKRLERARNKIKEEIGE